ncbi:hydrogenase maturation protein, carbamoyltransferase HypF [Longilinea arvoryzae]|uniref:Carbamoyltransferase n=1 Tax=Longilinea arvoryzae TaxID=360412 RepID=A0A0S7BMJ9_9CHLR|nr:carbamoyltransferase HypF [Longilinea arvoryzae]GAP14938.1 hydrogenase maturation protein, carbamoyltransferase HypF [Longilinea arvoryzae]
MTAQELVGLRIRVRGIVQGVGFRPFVYGLAVKNNLTGWVRNTSSGVEIEINGSPAGVQVFCEHLQNNPPPLARIDEIATEEIAPNGAVKFEILDSKPQPGEFIPVSPDMATCADCRRELFDPSDRRYRYPFINCTNCGPRFTIIKDIPYDRPKTTMAPFAMCPDCESEYHDPLNRRFHAQPVACSDCGPQVWFTAGGKKLAEREDAIQMARRWLRDGKILAIKGLGGFHLACDATNAIAVDELRRRKKRSDKAFALMATSLEAIQKYCRIEPSERKLLESPQAPIVLLEKRADPGIAPQVAPGQRTLGIMLPYTPIHLLLLEPEAGYPDVLVMTSGNLSEEPIAYQDGDADERLSALADGFLLHNREIHMRTDDSVLCVFADRPYFMRRARGYAPDPIQLGGNLPPILATGAELKNTFCLTNRDYAFLSHHIGDLENYETLRSFEEGIEHYQRLFRVKPELLACDLHPNYLATRYAQERAQREGLPLVQIQHHHAHLAACLADNRWTSDEPVIGLSLDGTGYGTDGAIWGGEVLLGGYTGYQRLFHLKYAPLAGGDLSVRKPARMALAHLWAVGREWEPDLPPAEDLCMEERTALRGQLEHHLNTPNTSSMGRLFDAASALMGIRQTATYEGQAAIEMEARVDRAETKRYTFDLRADEIDPSPMWDELIADWRAGVSQPRMAARFHNGVAVVLLEACQNVRQRTGCRVVALSGGVWQNITLLGRTIDLLRQAGFEVLHHQRVPTNDGGLALGQALIAARSQVN